MTKAFKEVFPTLKVEKDIEGLLNTTEITRISANREGTQVRIYLHGERLIFYKNIRKLEDVITGQVFQNKDVNVKIIETFSLSSQYNPKTLMDVYKDSLLDELFDYSVIAYNILRTAEMEFTDENHLVLSLDDTMIARSKAEEIISFLET